MGKTLNEIVRDHRSLDEIMIETGGEITQEEQEKIIDSWMKEITSDLQMKADGYQYRFTMLEQAAEALAERAKMIRSASSVCDSMASQLKERMKQAMIEMNMPELYGKDFKFKLQNSPPAVEITALEKIPGSYTREKLQIEIDKNKIKADLLEGKDVPGACIKQGVQLRVTANKRVKELQ